MYLWVKAFHIVFMVTWFAGLFYIFRLFVYHVKFRDKKELVEVYQQMERRLIYIIMHPSMFLALSLGLILAFVNQAVVMQTWFLIKLTLVLCLVAYHYYSVYVYKRFTRNDLFLTENTCRKLNEVPALLLVVIIVLVVVKPWG